MLPAPDSTSVGRLQDETTEPSDSPGRSMGFRVLSRTFLRPERKSRPARMQLLVVARHRRTAAWKAR
jgi:hypothetical protein